MYEDWASLEAGLGRRGNDLKYWLTLKNPKAAKRTTFSKLMRQLGRSP